jgi:hypothetical protein
VVTYRIAPGKAEGDPAAVTSAPPGATFSVINNARTGAAGSTASVSLDRMPGSTALVVSGRVPAGGADGVAHDDDRQPDALFR